MNVSFFYRELLALVFLHTWLCIHRDMTTYSITYVVNLNHKATHTASTQTHRQESISTRCLKKTHSWHHATDTDPHECRHKSFWFLKSWTECLLLCPTRRVAWTSTLRLAARSCLLERRTALLSSIPFSEPVLCTRSSLRLPHARALLLEQGMCECLLLFIIHTYMFICI